MLPRGARVACYSGAPVSHDANADTDGNADADADADAHADANADHVCNIS